MRGILKGSMTSFADGMFSANLIGNDTMSSHDYDLIMNEFRHGLNLYYNKQAVQDHFEKFLKVLENLEGPVEELARQLRKKFEEQLLANDNTCLPSSLTVSVKLAVLQHC